MSEFKSLPETPIEKAEHQETDLFYKYLCKDKTVGHIEIDRTKIKYALNNYTVEGDI